MIYPTIIVAHKITNRVRLKLSLPLKDEKETADFLTEYRGIKSFEYNKISRSVLIYFDRLKISLNEILIRLSISYSKQYEMQDINVFTRKSNKSSSLVYLSLTSILVTAFIDRFIPFKSKEIVNFLSWTAVGSTSLAIIDHGYKEIQEHGAFDPELISSVYLFNAVKNGKLITGSLITWIAAFGRHSLDLPFEGVTIKVRETKNIFTGQPQYNISTFQGAIINDRDLNGKINMLRDIISNYVGNKQFKPKNSYYMGDDIMLDSKEVGASELFGESNNIIVKNRAENFSI